MLSPFDASASAACYRRRRPPIVAVATATVIALLTPFSTKSGDGEERVEKRREGDTERVEKRRE
ncbi:hypothetical protein M6B38_312885 [Iris pallida]|uniref:Uncharacterized protein n=1 Tax=Iris pallida TaxID=29817 RepID=A0AAX6HHU0_IRIPA|nr:hypothetical protein M6B38_312885 [Iris pallida]